MTGEAYDILVVGGGPVGLHAALKGAVLNHRVLLVDKGRAFSRVSQAPAIANIPGSPGISGSDLLQRGRENVRSFERLAGKELVTFLEDTEAVEARHIDGKFRLRLRATGGSGAGRDVEGEVLVLATGTVDRKPGVGDFYRRGHHTLSPFLSKGRIGYCILCEGWSVEDKRIAVIGSSSASVQNAVDFCDHFEGEVTLLTDGCALEEEGDVARLRERGVGLDDRVISGFTEEDGHLGVRFVDGGLGRFDKAFFSLGWYKVNNELACMLGAATDDEGYVRTDSNCEVLDREGNPIRGLFAVGDLRAGGWKQVVTGWGDAETAVIAAYAYRLPA